MELGSSPTYLIYITFEDGEPIRINLSPKTDAFCFVEAEITSD